MRSSYLKLKGACPVKKVNLKPVRLRGFGVGFLSRMVGFPTCRPEMDAILAVTFLARF